MTTSQEYNGLAKKFVKRLFNKPWKAKCKKCNSGLFLLPEDQNPGKILFRCVNTKCENVIDVTQYKDKYGSINKEKWKKKIMPDNIDEAKTLTLTIVKKRLKDKFYDVNERVSYNPVTRMQCLEKALYTKITDEKHKEFIEIIFKNV